MSTPARAALPLRALLLLLAAFPPRFGALPPPPRVLPLRPRLLRSGLTTGRRSSPHMYSTPAASSSPPWDVVRLSSRMFREKMRCPGCARLLRTPSSSMPDTRRKESSTCTPSAAAEFQQRRLFRRSARKHLPRLPGRMTSSLFRNDLHVLIDSMSFIRIFVSQFYTIKKLIHSTELGACDASKLAWQVAANCLDSLHNSEVKEPASSCCSPLFAAAESRKCFCSFLQELKVELSPISRKQVRILHRRCGGSHAPPRFIAYSRDSRQHAASSAQHPAMGSPPPLAPLSVSPPSPPAPAIKQEPPASGGEPHVALIASILAWLSHYAIQISCTVISGAVFAALISAVAWIRKKRKQRNARRNGEANKGTSRDKAVDMTLQLTENALQAMADRIKHLSQATCQPLPPETRSRGTSTEGGNSSPASEHDDKNLPQQEEKVCAGASPSKQNVAAPAEPPKFEATGQFSLRIRKWW